MPDEQKKYRSANYRGNARGLNKHEKAQGEDNYTMFQAFNWYEKPGGTYYKQTLERVENLAKMGITAMWLPPPTKASSQEGNGYDIYDLFDLGEFDQKGGVATKWGTKEELLALTKRMKELGIVAYCDAVLNHKAGADYTETFKAIEVAEENRNQEISDAYDIEGWTGFNFPGRKGKHSQFVWNFNHFTGVDYDDKSKKTSIFKIQGEGKTWAKAVDKEKGSFDYLMFADIDHAHPDAKKECIEWGVWVLKEAGFDGFRFDAIKHIDEGFIAEFVQQVRERVDNPDLFCVGEFWKDSLGSLTGYLDRMPTQFSVFDTPLHYNFKQAGDQAENYDIRAVFDDTVVQAHPMDAVTLVENHDTQPGQALESAIAPWFKPLAYSLILLRGDGYPCVFAGDLYGVEGEAPCEPVNQLSDIILARKLFAYGPTRDYKDHMNCWGWVREGDKDHDGCAVVICNGTGDGEKRMQIPDGHAGEVWTDVLGWYQGEVTIGDDGWADFKCHERSVSIWAKKDARGREEYGK
ncbi:hypothetical protein JCM5350_004508 [Sporobolomyces pararoseus]